MNIELQLKNDEKKNKSEYSVLNSEEQVENKDSNEQEEQEKLNIGTNQKEKFEKDIDLFTKKEVNENIFISLYEKIKSPLLEGFKKLLHGLFYCLYASSVFFYILSLEGCEKDDLEFCLVDDKISNYVRAGIKLVICCGIFSVVILIQILLKLSKVNYIIIITPYIILFKMFTGVNLKDHGTYNFIGFCLAVPVLTLLFYIIYYLFYSFYSKKYIKGIIIFSTFAILFIIYYFNTNCNNFYKGLGGVDLENNPKTDKCYFIRPNYCSMKFLDPFFDMSKLKGDCTGRWNSKKRFLKHLDKRLSSINHFYYPRIEFAPIEKTFTDKIFNYVYEHIDGVKENPAEAEKAEVFLDFENDIGKIRINVKRNETLIQEREALAKKNEVKFDNVYVFFLDHLSRNHFIKRMKKLTKSFEEMLYSKNVKNENNNKNSRYKKFNSYQFIKYQNLQGATPFNMYPLFYGVPINDKTGVSVTKFYKEKGFITANTVNSCYRDLYHINPLVTPAINFDHENVPMFCDTNLLDPDMFWAYEQGENSIFRKCLYGKDSHSYMIEYMTQFLEAYKDQRKYMRMCFEDSHEATMQVVKYLDEPLTNFLNLIIDKYSNNKTAFIFLTDHGGKLPGPYAVLFVEEFIFEAELAALFIMLPENNTKYDKNIVLKNEKRFLSNYDVYHTLLDFINVDESEIVGFRKQFGQSLLTEVDGMKRDCETAGVKGCYCHNYEQYNKTDK